MLGRARDLADVERPGGPAVVGENRPRRGLDGVEDVEHGVETGEVVGERERDVGAGEHEPVRVDLRRVEVAERPQLDPFVPRGRDLGEHALRRRHPGEP
jgi:hypothetical protein